jgi:hypothetical protein
MDFRGPGGAAMVFGPINGKREALVVPLWILEALVVPLWFLAQLMDLCFIMCFLRMRKRCRKWKIDRFLTLCKPKKYQNFSIYICFWFTLFFGRKKKGSKKSFFGTFF